MRQRALRDPEAKTGERARRELGDCGEWQADIRPPGFRRNTRGTDWGLGGEMQAADTGQAEALSPGSAGQLSAKDPELECRTCIIAPSAASSVPGGARSSAAAKSFCNKEGGSARGRGAARPAGANSSELCRTTQAEPPLKAWRTSRGQDWAARAPSPYHSPSPKAQCGTAARTSSRKWAKQLECLSCPAPQEHPHAPARAGSCNTHITRKSIQSCGVAPTCARACSKL